MRIVIQKFGGTSVATAAQRQVLADRVIEAVRKGYRTVVVVSAMGRQGDPYATDTLLNMASEVCPGVAPRELDLIASCGETVSAVIIAATLRSRNVETGLLKAARHPPAKQPVVFDHEYFWQFHSSTRGSRAPPSLKSNPLAEARANFPKRLSCGIPTICDAYGPPGRCRRTRKDAGISASRP